MGISKQPPDVSNLKERLSTVQLGDSEFQKLLDAAGIKYYVCQTKFRPLAEFAK